MKIFVDYKFTGEEGTDLSIDVDKIEVVSPTKLKVEETKEYMRYAVEYMTENLDDLFEKFGSSYYTFHRLSMNIEYHYEYDGVSENLKSYVITLT